jgi:hypothetical protein
MKDQAWLCGVNHHSNQVTLHIGTTAELRDIAEASGGQIAEVFQDEISEDTPWKDGPGWYYATAGAISYHKADSLEECVRAILTNDGHPLVFTVEEAIGHLDLGPDDKGARLWHHNKFKVLEAIRECIDAYGINWMPKPLTILVRDDDEWGSDGAVFFSEAEKDEFLRNCGWEDDDGCFEVEVPDEAREDVIAERPHGSVQLRREKGEIVKLEEV